ncbi:MAG: response regulator [Spirochaetaceae bacterium]|nr:MAG: response regulator [Spirochaetaceae bacterium]
MISAISLIDAAAVLTTLVTVVVLLTGPRGVFPGQLRLGLFFLLLFSFIHNIGNLLEWAGISHILETYEDFVVALIPILFIFLIYTYVQQSAENELVQSKERYEMLFNSGNDSVFVHGYTEEGATGQFIAVNELACELLGYSREELLKLAPMDIIASEFFTDERVTSQKLRQQTRLIFERILITKDGRRIPVEISSRMFEFGGRPITLSVARDLRARKDMEEQIRRSQRLEAIGRLAGGIAHDFNNLLTVIGGYSDVLLGEIDSASTLREEVEEIRAAAKRASSLTQQLLAFSRKQILQPKILDPVELVQRSEQMLRRLIGEDIVLAIEDPGGIWKIEADPVQMEQVILNLAINSRDAMPKGGRITIRLANVRPNQGQIAERPALVAGEYVKIDFSDTGTGMSSDTLAHLFEPFYTTKAVGKGSGLGLSTVYGIIKQSGGFIYAISEPGEGTTFEIYLPRIEESSSGKHAAVGTESEAVKSGTGMAILVVEDESWVREFISLTLRKHGFVILSAKDGEQAMEMWRRAAKSIDLVLTDLVMPGMSGVELCTQLRRQQPNIRCLLISGYASDRLKDYNVSETGFPFLAKPFTAQELIERINRVLAD